MIHLIRTSSDHPHFKPLVALLDEDLKLKDGDDHPFYAQFNKIDTLKHVIVAYLNNQPVGCGAFKKFNDEQVEIKRMFVQPATRGKGIGLEILNELEKWAAELHYTASILETGKKQPEAIRLYEKAGYQVIENYGQYAGVQNSVCMLKDL